jgi:lipopolysaccharide export system protein LptC
MVVSVPWDGVGARPRKDDAALSRDRAFAAARRHSRTVRCLRILLPLAAAFGVATFLIITQLGLPANVDLSAGGLSVTRSSIIMESPRLTGFTADGDEYVVKAARAIQALATPNEVRLETIEARFVAAGQRATILTAESGEYDHRAGTLQLLGPIAVDSSDGYGLQMIDAVVDFRAGALTSPNPVRITYGDSVIAAKRLSVSEGGGVFLFEDGVQTTLMPPKRGTLPGIPE